MLVEGSSIKDLSIVVPAFNEELILERNVNRLVKFFQPLLDCPWELIIADNRSTDKTAEIGRRLAESVNGVRYIYTDRKGVGAALKKAWSSCSSDILCYTDLDLPFPLENLYTLCETISAGYDIAIGSRYVKGGSYHTNMGRKFLSRLYSYWLKILFSCKFSDHCGIKAIKREAFLKLMPLVNSDDWFFGTELLIRAEKMGYAVRELPVHAHNDSHRNSKVKLFRTMWDYVRLSFKLRWELWWK